MIIVQIAYSVSNKLQEKKRGRKWVILFLSFLIDSCSLDGMYASFKIIL